MITDAEIKEFRTLLNESENPLFFFDDDEDGLCSFLVLWRHVKKGHGIVIKGPPSVPLNYLHIIQDYKADKLFILDKAKLEQEFIDHAKIPIIYLDHHPLQDIKGVKYYNPLKNDPNDSRPTSYWAYQITKENLWIAIVGMVGDWHIPEEELIEFKKLYPELLPKELTAGEILFNSKLGELAKIFNFCLKGPTKSSLQCIKVLTRVETPYEILNQTTPRGKFIFKHYEKINKRYTKRLTDALKTKTDSKLLIYTYPPDNDSFTSMISNELIHKNPDKTILVAKIKYDHVNISFRSKTVDLPNIINQALEGLEGYGGGHKEAAGAHIKKHDFEEFLNRIKIAIEKA
jgi:single-stranded DNA-specific DHH superfamily exonuclease